MTADEITKLARTARRLGVKITVDGVTIEPIAAREPSADESERRAADAERKRRERARTCADIAGQGPDIAGHERTFADKARTSPDKPGHSRTSPDIARTSPDIGGHGRTSAKPSPPPPLSPAPPIPPAPTPALSPHAHTREGRFSPPTLAEWQAYGSTLSPPMPDLEALAAFSHYEANGWRVGKNPMRDWKGALRTCHARWQQDATQPMPRSTGRNGSQKPQPAKLAWE